MVKKRTILFLSFLILFTGCNKGNKSIKYELKDNENYEINLIIKGQINNKQINQYVNIDQYNDKEIYISYEKNNYYIFNNNYYKDYYKKKKINKKDILYTDYKMYFDVLNKIKKVDKKDQDLIGNKTYDYVEFSIDKEYFNNFLKSSNISYKFKNDAKCYLYSDPNGYLYKIIYKNNDNNNNIKFELFILKSGDINKLEKDSNEILDEKDTFIFPDMDKYR